MRVRMLTLGFVIAGIAAGQTCDRSCLTGIVDQYLAAMVAHDASRAPFASGARYTENTIELPMSEGLWFTAVGLTDYKIYLADPQGASAAFIGVVEEHNVPGAAPRDAILALRLKVAGQRISEAEAVVVRNLSAANRANLSRPRPGVMIPLSAEQRVPRAELIRASNAYFDGIEQSNADIVPFHEECNRLENGMRTAGPPLAGAAQAKSKGGPGRGGVQTCTAGFNSGVFAVITGIQPRRVLVVDEEMGLTFGVYMFQHRGLAEITMKDGTKRGAPYFAGEPVTMPMAEMFKIVGGKIRDVEAIGVRLPYGSKSGWD